MSITENTLVITKPDYMSQQKDILQLLLHNGFRITHRKIVSFTPEQAAEFYKDVEKKDPSFPMKVMSLTKGFSEAIILNKVNAIKDLLTLMTSPNCCHHLSSGFENKIHASASKENSKKEILYIFPSVTLEPSRKLCQPRYVKYIHLLSNGIYETFESQSKDQKVFLSNWLFANSYESEQDACNGI